MSDTEDSLPNQVIEALTHLGFWAQRYYSGTIRVGQKFQNLGAAGTPQVIVLSPVFGFLYVRKTKGLTEHQVNWYTKARDHGLPVHIVHDTEAARKVVMRWRDDKKAMLEPVSIELTA